jgi:hypothetical protein
MCYRSPSLAITLMLLFTLFAQANPAWLLNQPAVPPKTTPGTRPSTIANNHLFFESSSYATGNWLMPRGEPATGTVALENSESPEKVLTIYLDEYNSSESCNPDTTATGSDFETSPAVLLEVSAKSEYCKRNSGGAPVQLAWAETNLKRLAIVSVT